RFLERVPIFLPRRVTRSCEIARQPRESRPEPRGRIARVRKRRDRRRPGEARPARIGIERVVFLYPDVVLVRDKQETQRPDDGLERGLAFKQIDADREIVREKELVAPAEKFGAVRPRSAHAARGRKLPRFKLKKIVQRQVEKNILADDRRVAFERALQIRMPKAEPPGLIWRLRARIRVTLPLAEPD